MFFFSGNKQEALFEGSYYKEGGKRKNGTILWHATEQRNHLKNKEQARVN